MSVCWAIARKMAIGAPPGTITKGRRAPNPFGPKLWSIEPRPQTKKVALMSETVTASENPRALLTRKTAVMGDAAITSTC